MFRFIANSTTMIIIIIDNWWGRRVEPKPDFSAN